MKYYYNIAVNMNFMKNNFFEKVKYSFRKKSIIEHSKTKKLLINALVI